MTDEEKAKLALLEGFDADELEASEAPAPVAPAEAAPAEDDGRLTAEQIALLRRARNLRTDPVRERLHRIGAAARSRRVGL